MRSTSGHKNDDYLACEKLEVISLNMLSTSGHKNDDYLACEKLEGISLNMFHGNICRITTLEVFIACVLKTIDKNSFNKRETN